jgi:hypothetical protein
VKLDKLAIYYRGDYLPAATSDPDLDVTSKSTRRRWSGEGSYHGQFYSAQRNRGQWTLGLVRDYQPQRLSRQDHDRQALGCRLRLHVKVQLADQEAS